MRTQDWVEMFESSDLAIVLGIGITHTHNPHTQHTHKHTHTQHTCTREQPLSPSGEDPDENSREKRVHGKCGEEAH